MAFDPTTFAGAAPHYLRGRPAYSAALVDVVRQELGTDGTGRLLDVGSGPAVLTVALAPLFAQVVALDPDHDMLVEAGRHAAASGVGSIGRVRAVAEAFPLRGPFRAVTFAQSFHRTAGASVAEAVYDLLEPGGAIVLIGPDADAAPRSAGPGDPPIPDDEVQELIRHHLGPRRRMGQGFTPDEPYGRFEAVLARTRFGPPVTVVAPGREDITPDVEGVVARYLSMSYAAPHLFGDRLPTFVAELRRLLEARTTTGRFWDWPGDTDVVIARKGDVT